MLYFCRIEFLICFSKSVQDTSCSTGALHHLQGTILYSSPAGEGMRLEYPFENFFCVGLGGGRKWRQGKKNERKFIYFVQNLFLVFLTFSLSFHFVPRPNIAQCFFSLQIISGKCCLIRNLDMQNHGWECEGSQGNWTKVWKSSWLIMQMQCNAIGQMHFQSILV